MFQGYGQCPDGVVIRRWTKFREPDRTPRDVSLDSSVPEPRNHRSHVFVHTPRILIIYKLLPFLFLYPELRPGVEGVLFYVLTPFYQKYQDTKLWTGKFKITSHPSPPLYT